MIDAMDIKKHLDARPYQPLTLITNEGSSIVLTDPDNVVLTKFQLHLYATPAENEVIPERIAEIVSLVNVARIKIEPAAA